MRVACDLLASSVLHACESQSISVQRRTYDTRSCLILHNVLKSFSKTDNKNFVQNFSRFFIENIPLCLKYIKNKLNMYSSDTFDVHRPVHRNIISIVKPARCTNVLNLFYFGMTLYMFRTVFPSIIRSSRLYIQQQAFVKEILLSACSRVRDGTVVPSRTR